LQSFLYTGKVRLHLAAAALSSLADGAAALITRQLIELPYASTVPEVIKDTCSAEDNKRETFPPLRGGGAS
jgi:hypothetical protein